MAAPTLAVCRVSRRIGRATVLSDVSFEIADGGIHVLVGLNGAGKTTLLRLICGVWAPTTGDIRVAGELDPRRNPRARSRLGALIESPSLFPELTPREHLAAYGRLHGTEPADTPVKLLEEVGLGHAADKLARHLSLGMRQRLGIALALLGRPKLILLDEPTNGLDPGGMVEMRALIRRRAKEHGTAFLISSHQLSELDEIGDRILLLSGGALRLDQPLQAFREQMAGPILIRAEPRESVVTYLQMRYGVSSVDTDNDGHIRLSKVPEDHATCLHHLVASGFQVSSFSQERPTLEQLFLHVLGDYK